MKTADALNKRKNWLMKKILDARYKSDYYQILKLEYTKTKIELKEFALNSIKKADSN